jgi:transcriptional regulator with XRE-family HTH domain
MSDKQPEDYADGWGELIRAHRAYIGVSQRTMATKLNMSERSLSDIEIGRRSCPPGFLNAVQEITQRFYDSVTLMRRHADDALNDAEFEFYEIPVFIDPKMEWERAVIDRAAVEGGNIMPKVIGDF